ncbi:MAG: prephenate dehydrogenase/arogenate dehydrogenase family protein [Syntrophorhabdaceae bacterium]|nr:prephenate dehydrogenase/arogenate dehydrogenase family protein [Syntrophorhabdaceae bacterium]
MRIVVLGVGHMGAWIALQLSKAHDVAVFDIKKERLRVFEKKEVTVLDSLEGISLHTPDILINAVSLSKTVSAFESAFPFIGKDCIIADIASIKKDLAPFYEKGDFPFVSMHPMFGPTFANMDELRDESVIVIKGSDKRGVDFFKTFFEGLGLKIFHYTFDEHDRMMAYSLTIPFISSMSFAACVDRVVVPGTTFARHMKIARGVLSEDTHLLSEILFNPYSLQEVDKITARLEYLKHIIRSRDYEELERLLASLKANLGWEKGKGIEKKGVFDG